MSDKPIYSTACMVDMTDAILNQAERETGKSPLLAAPFKDGTYRDESSDMAETREKNADLLFLVHELKAGRWVPENWASQDIVRKAVALYARDLGVTEEDLSTAKFTEAQLDEMAKRFRQFHSGPDHVPGEHGLTFNALRAANAARCPLFKNAKGETQHSGRDWSPNDWMVATFGELGEAANVMKKVRRGDMTMAEARPKLAQEFSDVVIYLDMLASECGVDMGEAVMETFNAKSRQLELPLFITETGYVRERRD